MQWNGVESAGFTSGTPWEVCEKVPRNYPDGSGVLRPYEAAVYKRHQ